MALSGRTRWVAVTSASDPFQTLVALFALELVGLIVPLDAREGAWTWIRLDRLKTPAAYPPRFVRRVDAGQGSFLDAFYLCNVPS